MSARPQSSEREKVDMARFPASHSIAAISGLMAIALVLRAAEPQVKPAAETKFTTEEIAFFEKEVRPLLQANCVKCHGGAKMRGGLRLTSRDGVLKGGDNGPAAVPGKPGESLLVGAINHDADRLPPRVEGMPPKGKLPGKDVETLTKWVKMGLPWTPGKSEIVAEEPKGAVVSEESKNYWCYRPVKRPDAAGGQGSRHGCAIPSTPSCWRSWKRRA